MCLILARGARVDPALRAAGRPQAVGADADVVSLSESGELGMVMANGEVMVRDGKACKHGVFELAL